MNEELQLLLLQSLDGRMHEESTRRLEDVLATSNEARSELERLKRLRAAIKESTPSEFRPFFANRVLQNLAAVEEEFAQWLRAFFRKAAIAGAVLIVIIMGYNLLQEGTFDLSSALAIPQPTLTQVLDTQILDVDLPQ